MKNYARLFIPLFALAIACTPKGGDHSHSAAHDHAAPDPLYDQVMEIHDDVMPMTEVLYNLKKELKKQLMDSAALTPAKKEELKQMITQLDSADNAMSNWMNDFNPLPESAGQEAARTYLESELDKIKNVRTLTLEAIEKATALKKP